jgi:hypothetical protein
MAFECKEFRHNRQRAEFNRLSNCKEKLSIKLKNQWVTEKSPPETVRGLV